MGQVYSQRFILSHGGGSPDFVVPVGYRGVIRQIEAFNASAVAPENAQLVADTSGGTVYQVLVPPSEMSLAEVRFVFEPGERFHAILDSDVDLYVGGYLLSLP